MTRDREIERIPLFVKLKFFFCVEEAVSEEIAHEKALKFMHEYWLPGPFGDQRNATE